MFVKIVVTRGTFIMDAHIMCCIFEKYENMVMIIISQKHILAHKGDVNGS